MPRLTKEQLQERLAKESADSQAREEKKQLALSQVHSYLHEVDVYQVTKDGKYWKYVRDSEEWVFNSPEALRQSDYRIRPAENWEQFLQVMQHSGRIKETKTYSFRQTPPSVLNMLRKDGWLQPAPGRTENTKYFDYFITAISGSKAENALHIKQVLGWKYLHPETWQLPCLALYGKGGAGKNLLAEKILPIIFGAKNCAKLMFKQVERFNESLAGKTVVFFDERPSREDESIMKFFIGQPTLSIEGKGHSIYQSDNTALYVLATNSPAGPVRIEKNGSERRWSFLKVKETLVEVFMRMEKVDEATAKDLITWADQHVYGNPTEVAHFLDDCIEEATKLEAHPHALHNEDYDELLQTQSDAADDVLHDIFIGYDKFQDITHTALYATYLQRAKAMNPGAAPLSSTNFLHRAMDFIMNNKLSDKVVRTKKRVNVKRGKAYTGKSQAYYSPKVHPTDPSSLPDRTDFFTSGAYLVESPAAARVMQLGHLLATAVNDEDVADRLTA